MNKVSKLSIINPLLTLAVSVITLYFSYLKYQSLKSKKNG